jgi:alpha-L-fucosidase
MTKRALFSPVKMPVVVNDRWGAGDMGKNGGFLTFSDHYDPGSKKCKNKHS